MEVEIWSKEENETFRWNVICAIIMGLGLRNLGKLSTIRSSNAIALWGAGPRSFLDALTNALFLGIGVWFLIRPFHKNQFLLLLLLNISIWLGTYSTTGAFWPHIVLLCAFGYFSDNFMHNERVKASSFFLAAIFSASVFFKLNQNYLNGKEFGFEGDFFTLLYINGFSDAIVPQSIRPALAWTSILIEASIAILAVFRYQIAAHLTALFLLCLSLVNPPVFFVYIGFLPFFILADDRMTTFLINLKGRDFLKSAFFWLFIILVTVRTPEDLKYPYDLLIWIGFPLALHAYLILRVKSTEVVVFHTKYLLMPCVVLFTVLLKLAGAPSPIGYSMFSASRNTSPGYEIYFKDASFCRILRGVFRWSSVVDAKFEFLTEMKECHIKFPTEYGMAEIKGHVCRTDRKAHWLYKKRNSMEWSHEDCDSIQEDQKE